MPSLNIRGEYVVRRDMQINKSLGNHRNGFFELSETIRYFDITRSECRMR